MSRYNDHNFLLYLKKLDSMISDEEYVISMSPNETQDRRTLALARLRVFNSVEASGWWVIDKFHWAVCPLYGQDVHVRGEFYRYHRTFVLHSEIDVLIGSLDQDTCDSSRANGKYLLGQ